jgi:Zn-dependent protease
MPAEARRPTRPPGHRTSFPIARITGIEVRVHWTFLLLLALFAWAGPQSGFGSSYEAVLWVVVLFACVVAHEFAHSVVARRRGGDVHEILLFPLGGVSKLEHLPESPADEFAIAIAGPLCSIGLAVAAAVFALGLGRPLLPPDLVRGPWLSRIVWANALLAAFNLLPAFPLDGGRVFRALLERRLDLLPATRIATRVGHALAAAFVIVGLFADLWLAFIGVFVYFGASAEERATVIHTRLKGHQVFEIMRVDLDRTGVPVWRDVTAGPDDLLTDELVAEVAQAPAHEIAVIEHDAVIGVLRLEDIERLVARPTS